MALGSGKKIFKSVMLFFAAGILLGMLNTVISISSDMAVERNPDILDPVIGEFTGALSFVLLLPVMLYFFRKYPISRKSYLKPILIYLTAFIPVGALHLVFMYFSRDFIYGLIGWGHYHYGSLPYRIVMEYIKMMTGMMTAFFIYNLIGSFREREAEKVRRANLEEQLARTRLDALKSQLNPHFLFNTLNMISSVMYEDVKKADRMITNLSLMLRETLKSTSRRFHSLGEELEQQQLYIDIMKARFADRLQVSYSVGEDTLGVPVPHFLLQPLIENSIKHGMENLVVTKINISSSVSDNRLIIEVIDNGPGIKEDREQVLKKGIGLSNTIERLEKTYGTDYSFGWVNLEEGLKIMISIPVKVSNNE